MDRRNPSKVRVFLSLLAQFPIDVIPQQWVAEFLVAPQIITDLYMTHALKNQIK